MARVIRYVKQVHHGRCNKCGDRLDRTINPPVRLNTEIVVCCGDRYRHHSVSARFYAVPLRVPTASLDAANLMGAEIVRWMERHWRDGIKAAQVGHVVQPAEKGVTLLKITVNQVIRGNCKKDIISRVERAVDELGLTLEIGDIEIGARQWGGYHAADHR